MERHSQVREAATALRKAKGKLVAVYDAAGKLVGTVDESKITTVGSGTPADAPAAVAPVKAAPSKPVVPAKTKPAPLTPEDATDGPALQAAEEIAKSLAGQRFSGGTQSFAKSAGGSVNGRYGALVKSLDPSAQDRLSDAVARSAMRFQFGLGTEGTEAVRLAKSVALDLAAAEARKPRPGIESASAAVRGVHDRPRTVR